jgi:very-short-patch-repair endonuclease
MNQVERMVAELVAEKGWRAGTSLENRVMRLLSRFKMGPGEPLHPRQQYRVGKYLLDFAWPAQLMALEADGPYHRMPAGAARDAERDAWLRGQGWVIFRVDDTGTEHSFEVQVARVCRIVRGEEPGMWIERRPKSAS